MDKSRLIISSIGAIILFQLFVSGILAASGEVPENAIAGWRELDRSTEITSVERTSTLPSGKGPRTSIARLAVQGQVQKLETESRVWLKAQDAFYVLRKTSAGAWQMEQSHGLETESDDLLEFRKNAFSIVDFCILDAIEDKNFVFSNWRDGKNNLSEFHVKNLEEERLNRMGVAHKPAPFENVTVRVDPANHFRIVEFEHSPSQGGVTAFVKTHYEYSDDQFFPSSIRQTSTIDY